MKQLDLGSANALRAWDGYDAYGIDIVESPEPKIKQCDFNVETLPFKDNTFDLVTAYDFLEHIIPIIYFKEGANVVRHSAMIQVFNEIFRVLKDNGTFYSQTPINDFSDPTHVAHWTADTFNHFSGDYFGFHDHYGHTSRFEKQEIHEENNHVYCTMRAIKSLPKGAEYKITYTEVTQ